MGHLLQPLPSRSLAEDERVLLARTAFVPHVLHDPRAVQALAAVEQTSGLLAAANGFAALGNTFARRIGLSHRRDLFDAEIVAHAIDAVPPAEDLRKSMQNALRALAEAGRACEALDAPIAAARLEVAVREMGTPWRWLAIELAVQYCHVAFFQRLCGTRIEHGRVAVVDVRTFEPNTVGSSVAAAFRDQMTRVQTAAERYLTQGQRIEHREPKAAGEHLERYGFWAYRRNVQAPPDSLIRIARDGHTSTADVRRGIEIVWPLLDRDRLATSQEPGTGRGGDGC